MNPRKRGGENAAQADLVAHRQPFAFLDHGDIVHLCIGSADGHAEGIGPDISISRGNLMLIRLKPLRVNSLELTFFLRFLLFIGRRVSTRRPFARDYFTESFGRGNIRWTVFDLDDGAVDLATRPVATIGDPAGHPASIFGRQPGLLKVLVCSQL